MHFNGGSLNLEDYFNVQLDNSLHSVVSGEVYAALFSAVAGECPLLTHNTSKAKNLPCKNQFLIFKPERTRNPKLRINQFATEVSH